MVVKPDLLTSWKMLELQFLTVGALHQADSAALRTAAISWHDELAPLPKPLLVVNMGGPTSKFLFFCLTIINLLLFLFFQYFTSSIFRLKNRCIGQSVSIHVLIFLPYYVIFCAFKNFIFHCMRPVVTSCW